MTAMSSAAHARQPPYGACPASSTYMSNYEKELARRTSAKENQRLRQQSQKSPPAPGQGVEGKATAGTYSPVDVIAASKSGAMAVESAMKYDKNSVFHQRVELYRGSVSVVYKAVCAATTKTVIVKAYKTHKMSPKQLHKAKREIALMQALRSDPGVVRYLGHFEDQYMTFIIMEYCSQGDLFRTVFLRGGSVDEEWAVRKIIAPMLQVLSRLHRENILHRDIKPENIFLSEDWTLKLGDFGLALDANQELPFTRSGTLDYMAPEVLANPATTLTEGKDMTVARLMSQNVKPYNEKVDIWAVGILCYELIVGRPPFEVENEQYTMSLIMNSNNINFPTHFSKGWSNFVSMTLNKNPELRPSAAELLKHPWIQKHMEQYSRASSGYPQEKPQTSLMTKRNSAPSGLQGAVVCAAQEVAKMSLQCNDHPGLLHHVASTPSTATSLPPRPQSQAEQSKQTAPKAPPAYPSSPKSPMIAVPRTERPMSAMQAKRPSPLQPPPVSGTEPASGKGTTSSPQSVLRQSFSSSSSSYTSSPPKVKESGDEDFHQHASGLRSRIKLYFQRQMGKSANGVH